MTTPVARAEDEDDHRDSGAIEDDEYIYRAKDFCILKGDGL